MTFLPWLCVLALGHGNVRKHRPAVVDSSVAFPFCLPFAFSRSRGRHHQPTCGRGFSLRRWPRCGPPPFRILSVISASAAKTINQLLVAGFSLRRWPRCGPSLPSSTRPFCTSGRDSRQTPTRPLYLTGAAPCCGPFILTFPFASSLAAETLR